jgi:hypothetical protein
VCGGVNIERGDINHSFTGKVERMSAGNQHLEVWRVCEQVGKIGRGRQKVLEIVQHEKMVT